MRRRLETYQKNKSEYDGNGKSFCFCAPNSLYLSCSPFLTLYFDLIFSSDTDILDKSPVRDAAVMLSLIPHVSIADDEDPLSEIVFLIDRSGSMAGKQGKQTTTKREMRIYM